MQRLTPLTTTIRPVVVGFDGSPDGATALRWAARDAQARHVPLRVVRAWRWDDELAVPMRHQSASVLAAAARDRTASTLHDLGLAMRPDLLEVVVSGDEPGRAILSATHDAAVAVVGRHQLSLRERMFVGSVGDFVLEHTGCPTVVVPIRSSAEDVPGQRFVVVGIDGSVEGREALTFAAGEAARRNATLTIVVAELRSPTAEASRGESCPVGEGVAAQQRLLRDTAEHASRMPGVSGIPLELRVGTDAPGPCLVSASAGGQLLVVGSHGREWLGRLALGSVSRYCVQHATVPVAVVPQP